MVDDAIQSGRYVQPAVTQLGRIFLQNGIHGLDAAVAFECAFAGNHFVENGSEAEQIGTVVESFSAHLLRRHVTDRTHHSAGLGRLGSGHGRGVAGSPGFQDRLFG